MNYKQALKWLYSLGPHKVDLGLGNIKKLLNKLNNPHKQLKCIHVAGTNGKGSVCAMISSILTEAGYKVGMYTSPHLVNFNERIKINNKEITNNDIAHLTNKIKAHYQNQTFFEVITALAFLYFKEKNIDYLVLEVGLGGRLDATNVINPLLSIITNIDIEHIDYLGRNIKQIAYEKAGIIKNNKPVVTGAKGKALETIKKISKKRNSKVFLIKKYKKTNDHFNINNYRKLKLNLKGDFQLMNAAIAVTAVDTLKNYYKMKINKDNIKKGLQKSVWHGRYEFLTKNLLVDCAHNPAAALALKKELLKIKDDYKKKILIIGILKDKDYKTILKLLVPLFDKIIITKPKISRALEPEIIAKQMPKNNFLIKKDFKRALSYAKSIAKNDLILVTGSIYLVGEVFR